MCNLILFDDRKTNLTMMLIKIKRLQFTFSLGLIIILSSCSSQLNQNTKNDRIDKERINTEKIIDMEKEEKKIRNLFAEYVFFWNRHEMDKWGTLFAVDTKFITWSGGKYNSNKENIESHVKAHKRLQEVKQNMTYQLNNIEIKFLQDDIALVYATWVWSDFKTNGKVEDRSGCLTMVLVKSDDKWLIKTTQNTRVDKVLD